ncbi:M1 family metallopeptidase [Streptomyces sp. NPDC001941]|uniref:M1 family metallopeptidase n=1 Tax=Streptomyces sp. NPDC001941 TaxID=3154659 RepID=UPI003325E03C
MAPDLRTYVRAAVALLLAGAAGCTGVDGTPGAAGARDPYFPRLGNGGYDVRHYGLTLDYDPATRRLTGRAEITAEATQDLSAFNLDLAGMSVRGATVDGERATVRRSGRELTLRPRGELKSGSTFRAVVDYAGVPERITDADGSHEGWLPTPDGALGVGEPTGSAAWFPGNHHPSDKAAYDVEVTVPEGLTAVSNGTLKSTTTRAGRTTFSWHSPEPMASYLALMAIGKYDVRTGRSPGGVPYYTAVDPAVAKDADVESVRADLPGVVDWAVENFGPYPFSGAGAVVEPGEVLEYALETQTKPVFPVGAFDELTLVHEIAHQWFGNSVSPRDWRDMWLNESFATYAEWMYDEDFDDVPVEDAFQEEYDSDANWAFSPAKPPTAADVSEPPVYGRGAMVLHKVREAVGDDVFFEVLKGWPAAFRHGNASTADFTAYVEETADEDLSEVWDVWLYGEGRPKSPDA